MSATSRVGSTTVTVSRFRSRMQLERELRVMEGADQRGVLWQAVARAQTTYPWDSLLQAADEDQVVATSVTEAQAGVTTPLPEDLHPALREALAADGIEELWSHQADALEEAHARPHDRDHRHGQRQVARFQPAGARHARHRPRGAGLLPLPDQGAGPGPGPQAVRAPAGRFLRHAIYDGDTPREERRAIRGRSNLILTNPDMLHVGVLPNHRSWGDVLANLAWVVVDEAHVYRGVFGSHVANVLRRLRRLARAYGAEPRFVLTSATIANPRRAGRGAHRRGDALVDRDGAPHAERQIVMWNPPLVDEKLGKRASALSEAAEPARRASWSATCARSASSSRGAESS